MTIILKIQKAKDKTGKIKRVMWITLKTDIEGIGTFSSVSALGSRTPLSKEINTIVSEMLRLKKAEIKAKNKEKLNKLKKK